MFHSSRREKGNADYMSEMGEKKRVDIREELI
jgi:hypothetical protein